MNRNNAILVGSVGVMVVALVVWLCWPKQVSWQENLEPDNKHPYGTFMIRKLLENVRNDQGFVNIEDSVSKRLPLDPNPQKIDNYIFLGNQYFGGKQDIQAIMRFVETGNRAFILTESPGYLLSAVTNSTFNEEWILDEDGNYYLSEEGESILFRRDTLIRIDVQDDNAKSWTLEVRKWEEYKVIPRDWSYFNPKLSDKEGMPLTAIGTIGADQFNVICIEHGKGKIYFHSTPLVFTNYYLKPNSGMQYARAFMSHLGNGIVYWDEENRHYQAHGFDDISEGESALGKPNEGPLEFILSHRTLKYAWYFLLLLALLYMIFAGRRKQRPVRTISPPHNSSIEFTEVVSQLFLNQRDHGKLVQMKMDLWRAHAREKYRMNWTEQRGLINQDGVKELSERSGVPISLINKIIEGYNSVQNNGTVDTADLLALHNDMESYYLNCK